MSAPLSPPESLRVTPLHRLHLELGARMVPFAGYEMPVQYPGGILTEHRHCRTEAGLFDVSHMGQIRLAAKDGRYETAARALERLAPGDFVGLGLMRQRYSVFTNASGGIRDDFMAVNRGSHLFLIVNAACMETDYAHLQDMLGDICHIEHLADRALLALQGPKAVTVLSRLAGTELHDFVFMTGRELRLCSYDCFATRSGYTGEDGFELSIPSAGAPAIARAMLAETEVEAIGLGARDSLRLEAGLPLYGQDIDPTTSPIEAGLGFAVSKTRREQGGFLGADRILRELKLGPARRLVGLALEGRAPARAHSEIVDAAGRKVGEVTSGGFGPSLEAPLAMGYVLADSAAIGTPLHLVVRGKPLPAKVVSLPFVPHRYYRGKSPVAS